MDIYFWGPFAALLFLHLMTAKAIFRVYTPSRRLKECRDPSIQYWRFYMIQIASVRVLISTLLLILTQIEQTFISKYRLVQLLLQNIATSYAINLLLDSIFLHTKPLSRYQQLFAIALSLLVLFSTNPWTWEYALPLCALNELPNILMSLNLRKHPDLSISLGIFFLGSFLAARYIANTDIYPGLLANSTIGIQFKVVAILFEECQLIWSVYFFEYFFHLLTRSVKKLEESQKPRFYKKIRNIFQFLLRSKKGKVVLGVGIFTAFFEKTVIQVLLRNSEEMIHF